MSAAFPCSLFGAVLAVAPVQAAGPPDAPTGSATTYQPNPRHNGFAPGTLVLPLAQDWSVDLGATVNRPLFVNGGVFVASVG